MFSSHIFILKYYLRILKIYALRSLHFEHTHAATILITQMWDSLEGAVDTARFEGVKARLLQQENDAQVFTDVIVGYDRNVSGLQ